MKLYKLSQEINTGCDTYNSAIVCAKNEEQARKIYPDSFITYNNKNQWYLTYPKKSKPSIHGYIYTGDCWVNAEQLDKIKVEYIGEASKNLKKGLILASFNAG